MPYKIEQDGKDWVVVNSDSLKIKARHSPPDAKEKAERQLRLLEGIESGDWEPTHDE